MGLIRPKVTKDGSYVTALVTGGASPQQIKEAARGLADDHKLTRYDCRTIELEPSK